MNDTGEILEITRIGATGAAAIITLVGKAIKKLLAEMELAKQMKLISGQEYDKAITFLRDVKGQQFLRSIPIKSEAYPEGLTLEMLKEELNQRHISYHILPDINGKDGKVQIMVYEGHKKEYQDFFENYMKSFLKGGIYEEGVLKELSNNKMVLFNLPFKGSKEDLFKNLTAMNVRFAPLPDPIPDDNLFPMAVVNEDMKKINLLLEKTGEQITSTLADYWEEPSYLKTGDEQVQEDVKKSVKEYARKNNEKISIEEWLAKTQNQEVIQKMKNPDLALLSIDKRSLLQNNSIDDKHCNIRFPLTKNEREVQLILPKKEVYDVGNQLTLVTFLDKNAQYSVFRKENRSTELIKGNEIAEYFKEAKVTLDALKKGDGAIYYPKVPSGKVQERKAAKQPLPKQPLPKALPKSSPKTPSKPLSKR